MRRVLGRAGEEGGVEEREEREEMRGRWSWDGDVVRVKEAAINGARARIKRDRGCNCMVIGR
jgi:hypothetical protein